MGAVNRSEIRYRQYRREDYASLVALWQAARMQIEEEDDVSALEKFLRGPMARGFVAVTEDRPVGIALAASDGRYGYIHHLAVDPAHRRRGVALGLLERCKTFLFSEVGVRKIAVFVWRENGGGRLFWKASGFDCVDGLYTFVLRHS